MRNVWTIASTTYAELTRRPIYYITLAAFALLIFCSNFLTQFAFFKEVDMVREMGLASVALWGFIVIVALTGVIVTQELEDRTAVTLLSKPLRRGAFLLGKYFGLLMALFMGMVVLAGLLFYTLWWMAKGTMFGDPRLARQCLVAGTVIFAAGVALWVAASARIRRLEGETAVAAPRGLLRASFAAIALGAIVFLVGTGFWGGTLSQGDVQLGRLSKDWGGHYSVWEFVGSFMSQNGTIVIEGLLLCFLQSVVLAAICVAIAAFAPPVVSVAVTTLAFLLGNMSSHMINSLERLHVPAVTWAGRLLYYLLPNLGYFNLQTHFSEGKIVSLGYLLLATLHAGIYSTLALTISCSLFERREIR